MYRHSAVILAVLSMVALACTNPDRNRMGGAERGDRPGGSVEGFPSSMVALGDSLTAGYGSCLAMIACQRNSWSTGDGIQVNSHYRRILKANPAMRNHARNHARPGARIEDLPGQASAAASQRADYVTILIGSNDACRGAMTSVDGFRAKLAEALGTIKKAMPKARVLMVSLPDIYRVWEIGRTNKVALEVWKAGVCPNLLTNAGSTAPPDADRRRVFRDRVAAYNGQLRQACAHYGARCRFDDISTFAFEPTMLTAIDFFHPNAAGQEALADNTYPGTFTW